MRDLLKQAAQPQEKCSTLRKSFKYRIYPTRQQIDILNYQLREACDLYNCALEERIGAWKICRKSVSFYDQVNQLKTMRTEGLIGLPNFDCSTNVLRRLDNTFKGFFRRCKTGEKPGFPRFKSSVCYDSITFSYADGCKLLELKKLRIQGVGKIKVKLHRTFQGVIKTGTIKREAGRWFVIFSVECAPEPLPSTFDTVGIDMGLTDFATLSDGIVFENPRFGKGAERKLRIAQRRLSRRKNKKSKRRRKAIQLLQRQFAHMQNQRRDFHHKVSRQIVNDYGVIVVENLNVKGLAGGMLAKSVKDAGWGDFLFMLAYKAENAGREFMKVDPRGTSQTCLCGHRVPKTLAERWHSCPQCGLEGSRDHISAQVILSRARTEPSVANVEDVISCVGREAVSV